MGIVKTDDSRREEIEEFRTMLLACAAVHRRKDYDPPRARRPLLYGDSPDPLSSPVCVTSGISYLGRAVVNRLLLRGYSVRVMVDNQEDLEKLREMETAGEMGGALNNFRAVVAKLSDVGSLAAAFDGCRGVFHTASFADPSGLSGYSKSMAEIEVKTTESVMEACARTPSVRNSVLTSSLLACIWRDHTRNHSSPIINHESWSDEPYCLRNKLWYALGKLRAERAAWRIAKERGLRLTAICPGLITGPEFCNRNPTATIAYLKGAKEMYALGLLATVDAMKLADAHVSVFEEMGESEASGRYICYDHVVDEEKADKLARQSGMPIDRIRGEAVTAGIRPQLKLSNRKLSYLLMRNSSGSCRDES
ncbi:hypothetical protein MLD38_001360 [Melastoma candidum]|uniref:Uncharacterized protein n=1 Tax=Melastoma candidum TaxID=119954 RepID=A0ACB9SD21_9MYRT|nr:hypothetical protein MLD38_001360 [Melastoma candidum]